MVCAVLLKIVCNRPGADKGLVMRTRESLSTGGLDAPSIADIGTARLPGNYWWVHPTQVFKVVGTHTLG